MKLMRLRKTLVIFVFTIIFFLTVRIQTRGEIITQPLIDSTEIDLMIEHIEKENDYYGFSMDKDELINEIINMKLYQKAFELEAEKRGITVLDEEINGFIEEQVANFEVMLEHDDDMRKMYEELFEEQNISSVEEYFWDVQYDNIKASFLMDKLYLQFEKEGEKDIHYYEDFYLVIQERFLEENEDKIERLRRKYGVLDVEQPEYF